MLSGLEVSGNGRTVRVAKKLARAISTREISLSYNQGWEKSIVIDIQLRYSLLFVHRMHWNLYFFE